MKALVGAFNQEKALVGAFSVIVQPVVKPMDRFTALVTSHVSPEQGGGCGEEGEDSTDQDADEPLELHLLGSHRLGLVQQPR